MIISVQGLSKSYPMASGQVSVLSDLDMSVEPGEFVALMGPSGSGKTTLLNIIGGLDSPTRGTVTVAGTEVGSLSSGSLSRWRHSNIGFVFQFYNLMPTLSAMDNVALPLVLTGLSRSQRRRNSEIALELVGLGDRSGHKPREMSGGQQQRVAIARAIVSDPAILICDEPTGDLDRVAAVAVLDLLKELSEVHGKTIVMVTHDPKAATYANRCLKLDKGALESGDSRNG